MSTRILDHIVHLTPPATLKCTVEQWKNLGFNVSPGGTHADGLTENALVILSDSAYIELISFTQLPEHYSPGSPERTARETHPWAKEEPGWIDFAFLGFGSSNPASGEIDLADVINERAAAQGSTTEYNPTVNGGRTRPDGQVLRWRITAPNALRHGRGVLPFFCGDVTERKLRVPVDSSSVKHPNTAKGIAAVHIAVPKLLYTEVAKQIAPVVGVEHKDLSASESEWELMTYATTDGLPTPKLVLSCSQEGDAAGLQGNASFGISEIAFWVETKAGERDKTPYGRILWKSL